MGNIKRTTIAMAVAGLAGVAVPTVASAETVTVQPGDTLSEIASHYDGVTWRDLWRNNSQVVGNDPDLIFPGQRLHVGPPVSVSKGEAPSATAHPVGPATGHVTSPYGYRTHPITGVYKLHTGTDFSFGDGNAYAAEGGVVSVTHPEWAGNLVTIDHGNGVQTRYAHLAYVTVSEGQHVNAGQVVGRIGSEGFSTGAHLHFEVLVDGVFVNPMGWLK